MGASGPADCAGHGPDAMRTSWPDTIAAILIHEGGWANDPHDPGGCTKYGITLRTWRNAGHPRAECADLRRITRDHAAEIYREHYWQAVNGDELPAGVDLMICDHAVNACVSRAITLLQDAVGSFADGIIGFATLAAAKKAMEADPSGTLERIASKRFAYYRSLKTFERYGKGWTARVYSALSDARKLAGVM